MNAPLHLVLDTNTVLALWLFRDPGLTALAALIDGGATMLYSRDDALEELRRVLAYAQFGADTVTQAGILAAYRERVVRLPPAGFPGTSGHVPPAVLPPCRDRDDQKFLEIAAQAPATHLVTRDKALLKLARHRMVRDRFAILTPERFVAAMPPGIAAPR
ncbi:putative toxin-antitoxin system toxin component, PIN family [Thauera sinica]|uniref:Toxin-antitoxin system toxin component, PIN family n=1 Tax=Thauera sinica TaxID=2665146 RepID=A0ABW1ASK7_9RHOO|nr:putative toxin-antitoxin system toxin component, PIN family [Thauera sp. K11]ATE61374.1 putative toxin-antitoxin system toxin component, PIN family [Thauera sp. K11]